MWKINKKSNIKIKEPILIEGLPGVGNVGKIAVDFMIDSLKAKKLMEITSYNFPHCVFVNEKSLVELPTIELYYKNLKNKTLLFLSGDIQPIDEKSCYEFCDKILDIFQKQKGKEIITLGGLATEKPSDIPQIFYAASNEKILKKYAKKQSDLVGPIIGVSGLLIGLARKRKLNAISILAETYGHPTYLGINSAKELLNFLNLKLKLKMNIKDLEKDIQEIESEFKTKIKSIPNKEQNYIG